MTLLFFVGTKLSEHLQFKRIFNIFFIFSRGIFQWLSQVQNNDKIQNQSIESYKICLNKRRNSFPTQVGLPVFNLVPIKYKRLPYKVLKDRVQPTPSTNQPILLLVVFNVFEQSANVIRINIIQYQRNCLKSYY